MSQEEVLKYMKVLNNGYIQGKDDIDKKLLESFSIIFDEENSLYGYKRRAI